MRRGAFVVRDSQVQRRRRIKERAAGKVALRVYDEACDEFASAEERAATLADASLRELFLYVLRWAKEVSGRARALRALRRDGPDWGAAQNLVTAAGIIGGAALEAATNGGVPVPPYVFLVMAAGHIGAADAQIAAVYQHSVRHVRKGSIASLARAARVSAPGKSTSELIETVRATTGREGIDAREFRRALKSTKRT